MRGCISIGTEPFISSRFHSLVLQIVCINIICGCLAIFFKVSHLWNRGFAARFWTVFWNDTRTWISWEVCCEWSGILDGTMQLYRSILATWVLKTRLIEKKYAPFFFKPNCRKLQRNSKKVCLKIGSRGPKMFGPFISLFLMRKPLSSCQKWFLRPYFPLSGMF